ncbi:hypothetical protein SAMN03159358_2410 [Paenibacillus sp. NFR01]|nr:hypothetical protein SAMN03159358_2410 [Paenibacillus sp. NFR01]
MRRSPKAWMWSKLNLNPSGSFRETYAWNGAELREDYSARGRGGRGYLPRP